MDWLEQRCRAYAFLCLITHYHYNRIEAFCLEPQMNNHFGCGNKAGNLIRILLPTKVAFVLFTVRCYTTVFRIHLQSTLFSCDNCEKDAFQAFATTWKLKAITFTTQNDDNSIFSQHFTNSLAIFDSFEINNEIATCLLNGTDIQKNNKCISKEQRKLFHRQYTKKRESEIEREKAKE